ncbi:MAG: AAC(6')-Ii family aminoglycoside 6'-N-acetyltransferase, partial [Clostridiales bacterium]|nr:AAC(6')-Ii family aminoglycoside 6'-N-acetyltransferase [Clostridiales bacterium]
EVIKREGITIYLGSDDETNSTSLGGIDMYPDILEQIKNISNINNHPYEFYQKIGFKIVGICPDANGFGKPDIYMAKRVGKIT